MPLLKFILIFILTVFLISYIIRILFAFLIRRFVKKYGFNTEGGQGKPEGKVSFTRKPQKEKVIQNDVGEYIDYEDVKE